MPAKDEGEGANPRLQTIPQVIGNIVLDVSKSPLISYRDCGLFDGYSQSISTQELAIALASSLVKFRVVPPILPTLACL